MTRREYVDEMLVVEVGLLEYNRVLAGPFFVNEMIIDYLHSGKVCSSISCILHKKKVVELLVANISHRVSEHWNHLCRK